MGRTVGFGCGFLAIVFLASTLVVAILAPDESPVIWLIGGGLITGLAMKLGMMGTGRPV